MKRSPNALLTAIAVVLVACGSSTTTFKDFKTHAETSKIGANEAGFGPGWVEEDAREYSASQVEWLTAHPPEPCYALLHAALLLTFQAHAEGDFTVAFPPDLQEHTEAALRDC